MRAIAKLTGVSTAAVQRSLQTKEEIFQAAKKVGWERASILDSDKNVIGIVIGVGAVIDRIENTYRPKINPQKLFNSVPWEEQSDK